MVADVTISEVGEIISREIGVPLEGLLAAPNVMAFCIESFPTMGEDFIFGNRPDGELSAYQAALALGMKYDLDLPGELLSRSVPDIARYISEH